MDPPSFYSYDYPTLGDTMPRIMYMGHNPDKCIKEVPDNWRMYFDSLPPSFKNYMKCFHPPAQTLTDINQPAKDDDDYNEDRSDISLFAVDDDVIRHNLPKVAYPKIRIMLNKHRDDKKKMAVEIHKLMCFAQSPDGKLRTEAECRLGQLQKQNLSDFLLSLSLELSTEGKPLMSRKLAGIVLKNTLDTKEHLWVSHDLSLKSEIKSSLLKTLGTEAGHTAAQVISKVASIEIPRKEWPELISTLLRNMTQQDSPTLLKQATLEALGYICEETTCNDLVKDDTDSLFTALLQGMNVGEHTYVRLAATSALVNALDFAQYEVERAHLIDAVCKTTMDKEADVRLAAFKCLASVASTYYDILRSYSHSRDIFLLTLRAVGGAEQGIALQAIEFWSSICDEEIKLQDSHSCESCDSYHHLHLIRDSLPCLVPVLLETLLKRDEDQEDCISNVSMAGGTCLGLVSRTVGDDIVPLVMPFVQDNLSKSDWQLREAALRAFGSILEGPTVKKLSLIARTILDIFLPNAMKGNIYMRDTVASTLSRILELLHSPTTSFSVISEDNVQQIMGVLLETIDDSPQVVEKVCRSIYYLARGYEGFESGSSILTPYLADILNFVIATASRTDANNTKLRSDSFETLKVVVRGCNIVESSQIITTQLLPVIMTKLEKTFELQIISSEDIEKQGDLQVLLCGVMRVIIEKLGSHDETKPDIFQFQAADGIMVLFFKLFASGSSTVHEEAMLAVGVLAKATGLEFAKYMSVFYKYLEMGLQNFEENRVCSISFEVVGDICRALGENMLPFCDGMMSMLLKDLSSADLEWFVTPLILSCFGDVARAIGRHFDDYIGHVMPLVQQVEQMCSEIDVNDEAKVKHRNLVNISIFRTYSDILRGIKSDRDRIRLRYAPHLIYFIEEVVMDDHRDESVVKAIVEVLGDLVPVVFKSNLKDLILETFGEFLDKCVGCQDQEVEKTARLILSFREI